MPRKLVCECGECKTCQHREYQRKQRVKKQNIKAGKLYPIPHQITVWECSDGREFANESDALRYELDLFRKG